MERVLLKEYKNGNKLWGVKTRCVKCSGTGKVIWSYANHRCFDCNGKGWYYVKERELTPENIAKEAAKRAKEAAEQSAKEEAERAEREAREAAEKAEREAYEAKRRGHYFGEIGQKIEMEVIFTGWSDFETMFGTMNVYRFDTDDGAHMVWKSSAVLGGYDRMINEGDRITIRAAIKDHKEYRGIEQTELTRVKVIKGGELMQ